MIEKEPHVLAEEIKVHLDNILKSAEAEEEFMEEFGFLEGKILEFGCSLTGLSMEEMICDAPPSIKPRMSPSRKWKPK